MVSTSGNSRYNAMNSRHHILTSVLGLLFNRLMQLILSGMFDLLFKVVRFKIAASIACRIGVTLSAYVAVWVGR